MMDSDLGNTFFQFAPHLWIGTVGTAHLPAGAGPATAAAPAPPPLAAAPAPPPLGAAGHHPGAGKYRPGGVAFYISPITLLLSKNVILLTPDVLCWM